MESITNGIRVKIPFNVTRIADPAYCEDEAVVEYGVGENEAINLTCNVKANPAPASYRWVLVNEAVNITTLRNQAREVVETEEGTLLYERPNGTAFSKLEYLIISWLENMTDVSFKQNLNTTLSSVLQ